MKENNEQEAPKYKTYYCAQIEAQVIPEEFQTNSPIQIKQSALKLVDPAIMESKARLTRYRREELMSLKHSISAQMSPPYHSSQNIIRLDIKRKNDEQVDQNEQFKALRNMLPNLSIGNWDPSLFKLLNNYHRSLLYPQENHSFKDYNQQRYASKNDSYGRRVSWGDQKQQFEELPTYDNKVFFDHITTTTTMKPPRMGIGSLGYQKQRPQNQFFRNAKGNNCANDAHTFYQNNLSAGSLSLNETKSSYDESIMDRTTSDKSDHNNNSKLTDKTDDSEQEPEWFSFPASRHDVIDLHGFEEDEPRNISSTAAPHVHERPMASNSPKQMAYDDFSRGKQVSPQRRQSYSNRLDMNNVKKNNEFYNRCRNNMDTSYSSSSFNSSGSFNREPTGKPEVAINPFFEMWKQQQQQIAQTPPGLRGGMMTISDVESALKYNGNMFSAPQQLAQLPFMNTSVPQFFRNASFSQNYHNNGGNVMFNAMNQGGMNQASGYNQFGSENIPQTPTQEQLQLHTSEIMRNAMLRKHYQNERNFPKK